MSRCSRWALLLARNSVKRRQFCANASPVRSPQPLGQPTIQGPLPKPTSSQPSSTEHVVTARVTPVTPAAPSVNSTSLGMSDITGIQDPHTHDPLKWRKAAWKYLGALAVFGVFYKGLHWYVDGVAEKAKQKREDMEIAKTAVYETAADRAARQEEDARKAAQLLEEVKNPVGPSAASATVSTAADADGANTAVSDQSDLSASVSGEAVGEDAQETQRTRHSSDTGFQVFPPIQDDPVYVSPEDELKLLEVELEARLKKLRAVKTKTRDSEAEKRNIKSELRDVRTELAIFAMKAATKRPTGTSENAPN